MKVIIPFIILANDSHTMPYVGLRHIRDENRAVPGLPFIAWEPEWVIVLELEVGFVIVP